MRLWGYQWSFSPNTWEELIQKLEEDHSSNHTVNSLNPAMPKARGSHHSISPSSKNEQIPFFFLSSFNWVSVKYIWKDPNKNTFINHSFHLAITLIIIPSIKILAIFRLKYLKSNYLSSTPEVIVFPLLHPCPWFKAFL